MSGDSNLERRIAFADLEHNEWIKLRHSLTQQRNRLRAVIARREAVLSRCERMTPAEVMAVTRETDMLRRTLWLFLPGMPVTEDRRSP